MEVTLWVSRTGVCSGHRARSGLFCLSEIHIRNGSLGEPQAMFMPPPALAGTDARRGLAVALELVRTAVVDSEAVLIVRKAQRRG